MKILSTHTRVGTVQGLAWHSQAAFPQGSSAPSALWEPCAGMLPTPGAGEKNPHKKEDFLPSFFFFFLLVFGGCFGNLALKSSTCAEIELSSTSS